MELFPHNSNINFMRLRSLSLGLAALLMFGAIAALAFKGFNYALDFTGGTAVELRFEQPVNVEAARSKLAAAGFDGATVQNFGSGNQIAVRLRPEHGKDDAEASNAAVKVLATLGSSANPGKVMDSGYVGPQIGKELAENGIYAGVFVVLGFLFYVWARFEWKFAVAAIIATLHDVLLVCGWFALTGHEFDLAVLAGVLSVMGYSINDTIVVFDRVRENFRSQLRATPAEVLNKSVNQTLSRTVITSFVAFLTVLALYLYAGNSLKGMAESQMLGIVIGTLSSIFVACPLLLWLGVSKQDLLPKARDEAELARRP